MQVVNERLKKLLLRAKGWKLPILAMVGVGFALVSAFSHPSSPQKEPHQMPPGALYAHSVAGIGVVEPRSEVLDLGVEIPGIVRLVRVKVGDHVEPGDVLFELDQRDVEAQLVTLEAMLASAQIQAQDALAQFDMVRAIKDKRAVSREDFNKRQYAAQLAQSRVQEMIAQRDRALVTKQRLTITAPIAGEILEVNVRVGEYASAGALADPLLRMGDVSQLYVRVEIDEENAHRVHPSNGAVGFKRGFSQKAIPLTFVRTEPYVRPKHNLAVTGQRVDTRVVQVLYAIAKSEPEILVGQQMDVFVDETYPAAATEEP